jgi:hypothetical protein
VVDRDHCSTLNAANASSNSAICLEIADWQRRPGEDLCQAPQRSLAQRDATKSVDRLLLPSQLQGDTHSWMGVSEVGANARDRASSFITLAHTRVSLYIFLFDPAVGMMLREPSPRLRWASAERGLTRCH